MSILGLDVGTSTCKGIVISQDGRILAQKRTEYSGQAVVRDDIAEISAEVFWNSTAELIRNLALAVENDPIEALAVSSHGETLIPIGRNGEALMPAMLSMDRRCQLQSERLMRRVGQEKIYALTGSMMHPQFPIPKIMWLKEVCPEVAAKAVHYDSASDYIHRKLGIANVVDYSMASRFGGFDIHRRCWSEEILDAAGVKENVLSRPVCGGTVLGEIPVKTAEKLGLGKHVLLAAGGHDQACAAIGMGNVEKGVVTVSAGSYECVAVATEYPLNHALGMRYGLNSYCHVLPGRYITLAFFVSGLMTKWYIDTFCGEEKRYAEDKGVSCFELLDSMYGREPTGICITPHIFGSMNPEWDEHRTARLTGLTAAAGKADLYKAVLEGTCCELDLNLCVLEKMTGPIQKLLMTGGGTNSRNWMQMRADITGKNIDAVQNMAEASCIGAALLAGLGLGMFNSLEDANRKIRRERVHYFPSDSDRYRKQKAEYLTLHRPGLLG